MGQAGAGQKRKSLRRRWPWRFLRVFRGFVGFGIVQECVTCRGALFSENSKFYVILEVFLSALNCFVVVACAGAVFYENLVLPCVLSIDFEG